MERAARRAHKEKSHDFAYRPDPSRPSTTEESVAEFSSGRSNAQPYYDLIANIAAEEYSHIETISYAINLMLTGTTVRGTDPTVAPLAGAKDARNSYRFLASGQTALPVDSQGNFWTGQNVFSSSNLKMDLLHNFFLECGARANKIRVYEMVDDPTARQAVGYLLVRGGVHIVATPARSRC